MRPALVLALCIGCNKPAPAPAAASGPPLAERFAFEWPDGLAGVRSATKITTRIIGDRELRQEIHTTEDQRVERTESGWLVHSENGRFLVDKREALDPSIEALAAVHVAFEVEPDGRFGGLHDSAGWEREARAAVLGAAEEGDVIARVKADAAVQPRALEGVLSQDWYARVDFWLGKPAAPGSEGLVPGTSPTGDAVTGATKWQVQGPVRCGDSGPMSCVEATAEVAHTPEELESTAEGLLDAWLKASATTPERAAVDHVEGTTRVEIVVEPGTLVIYRYLRSWSLESAAQVDGAEVPLGSSMSKSVSWSWSRGGGE